MPTELIPIDFYAYDPELDFNKRYNYVNKKKQKLTRGAIYSLRGNECDGFKMPERLYQVVNTVAKFGEVSIDSVIMKQIGGPPSYQTFTLTKNECNRLHIKYEEGLQIWPKNLKWKRKDLRLKSGKVVTFDPSDMSTYALSRIDGTIRYIIVKVLGYQLQGNHVVDLGSGERQGLNHFLSRVHFKSKGWIYQPEGRFKTSSEYKPGEEVPFRLLIDNFKGLVEDPDFGNCLFFELCLKKATKGFTTEDGFIGVASNILKKRTINDLFTFEVGEKRHKQKEKPVQGGADEKVPFPQSSEVVGMTIEA